MAYLDRALPDDVARGALRTPEFRSNVVQLASGREERNRQWSRFRLTFDLAYGIRSADDLAEVLDLFADAGGRVDCFRLRDWQDCKSCLPSETPAATDQILGTGTGTATAFQVVKRYGIRSFAFDRPILLPRQAGFRVAVAGVEVLSGWSLSATGGVLTFAAPPAAGQVITAGYVYDVPVRFDTDALATSWEFFDRSDARDPLAAAASVPLVEVLELV